jgi:drug/metabolite transporter (DMT)-like permease
MHWAQVANAGASACVALAAAVFVVAYAVLAPWRRSEVGRHLMSFTAVIGLLGFYTVLITVWPAGVVGAVLRVARVVLLLAVAALLVQRTRLLIRAQRKPHRNKDGQH